MLSCPFSLTIFHWNFQNFQIQKSCKDVFLGNYQIISLSGTLSCNFQPEMKIALADDEVTNRNYAADTVLIISFWEYWTRFFLETGTSPKWTVVQHVTYRLGGKVYDHEKQRKRIVLFNHTIRSYYTIILYDRVKYTIMQIIRSYWVNDLAKVNGH